MATNTICRTVRCASAVTGRPARVSLRRAAETLAGNITSMSRASPAAATRAVTGISRPTAPTLLTALAAQGFDLLAQKLVDADDVLEAGVAYVDFAVAHRAYFEVMFRPELYRADDAELIAARERSGAALRSGVATLPTGRAPADTDRDALAAWSIAHGFAIPWLAGALPKRVDNPGMAARDVLRRPAP